MMFIAKAMQAAVAQSCIPSKDLTLFKSDAKGLGSAAAFCFPSSVQQHKSIVRGNNAGEKWMKRINLLDVTFRLVFGPNFSLGTLASPHPR
jgi:hypothetical protein